MSVQDEITALQAKRVKYRTAGYICGFGALFVFVWAPIVAPLLGGLTFFVWLSMLVCGFIFRSVAVQARDSAKFLEMQLAAQGLTPNLSPLGATTPIDPAVAAAAWNNSNAPVVPKTAPAAPVSPAAPATASAPEPTIESRLAKARRTKN